MRTVWVECLGAEVRYYRTGPYRTRCIEAGAGDPVVLLHGVGGHAETWVRNVVPLSKRFHVFAIDMLGHGLTSKPTEVDYNIPAYAEHLGWFLDAAGIEQAHLVGESLGGWVAAWYALHHPTRVRKLALVCSAGLADASGRQVQAQGREQLKRLSDAVAGSVTREAVRKRLEFLVHDPHRMTDEMVEIRYAIYSRPDSQAVLPLIFSRIGDARAAYVLTPERLRGLRLPILFLWTRHDPTCPWEFAWEVCQQVEGSSWYLMEDAGHWPQFEKPDEFNEALTRFSAA